MYTDIFVFALWVVCGVVNLLLTESVSKSAYFCCWFVLLIYLIKDVMR